MTEDKGFGLSFVMLLITALIVTLVMKGVNSLVSGGHVADVSDEAVLARIKPVGSLNTGEPIVAAAVPAATAEPAAAEPKAAAPAAESPAATAPAAAAPAKASARTGEQVYSGACQACHATGLVGAPKLGDKVAWSPRIQQGMDTLLSHALKGFKAMPARGTCGNCSDEEIKNAIDFMVSKSK